MNSTQPQSPAADELMARIRAEVARRRGAGSGQFTMPSAGAAPALSALPVPHLSKPIFVPAQRYALGDFLALHDRDFIAAAYRGVLKRPADPHGEAHFLGALRRGDLSKIEILGRLRYSPEGRKQKVPVRGLFSAFAVQHSYRIPVLGRCIATLAAILRLPLIVRNLQRVESYQHSRNAEVESAVAGLAQAAAGNEQALLHRVEFARGSIAESSRRIGAAVDALQQRQEELDGHWRRIADAVDETQQEILAATERFAREAEEDRTANAQSREALSSSIAGHAADLAHVRDALSARLDENAAELARVHDALAARVEDNVAELARVRNALADGIASNGAAAESAARRAGEAETRLANLEGVSRNREILEQQIGAAIGEINEHIAIAQRRLEALEASTAQGGPTAIATLEERLARTLRDELGTAQTARTRLAERLARVEGRLHEQSMLLGAAANAPAGERTVKKKGPAQPILPVPASPRFEAVYFAFEQRFRGTREQIRERLRYYLPLLRNSVVGSEGSQVLDIGCGRGEWLELLRDENIAARGIDINDAMVRECRQFGLDVAAAEAIAELKRLPDNALGALTGFHIIEHVPLETLLELIEQARRVVAPGGLLIFETPNPENLIVGACNFYVDPTHQRPLPPVMTQFLVEQGGFSDVEIHRVNAHLLPKLFDDAREDDPPTLRTALQFLQSAFACAPDYSVVGRVT